MSDFATRMAASSAASDAAAAKKAARAAQAASEERLEGTTNNPFVTLDIRELEDVEVEQPKNVQRGFFAQLFNTTPTKEKLAEKGTKVSIKRTDISYMEEKADDFGTLYTEVYLEDRCDLEYSSVYVPGSLEENQQRLNGAING